MNNDNLNIEEIREKCNVAIDYLIEKIIMMQNLLEEEVRISEIKINQTMSKYDNSLAINDNLLSKVANVIKYGVNIFAMTVLNIDREFLDFSLYKNENKNKYHLPKDNSAIRCISFFKDIIPTLYNIKQDIAVNNNNLLLFYRGLVNIAYNNYNFWDCFFETVEKLDIEIKYSKVEKMSLFPKNGNVSKNPTISNELRNLLDDTKINKIKR